MTETKKFNLITICPEVFGGLSTPRNPSDIKGDKVFSNEGLDVTKNFYDGALKALEILKQYNAKYALLKEGSPSCGVHKIYDGTFSGKKIPGFGVTTKMFKELGIKVYSENEIDELCNNCTWTWITKNQVNGCKIEGPNGNCIFLPATGYHNYSPEKIEKYNEGLCGAYWSSSLLTSLFARSLWCNSEGASKSFDLRSCSLTIRPVCPK